ncbi:MAG: type IV pilus twitching motility protein PilT [Cellulosilyticaceae bacterium]
MNYEQIFLDAIQGGASDIFIVAGFPIAFKIKGVIEPTGGQTLCTSDTEGIIKYIYSTGNREMKKFQAEGDDDFSVSINGIGRFRVNVYKQRSSQAAVIRVVRFNLPDATMLGIPQCIVDLHKKTKGLVLITGPAGAGKSTTLSCIINKINQTRQSHIITLEDPIEFVYKHHKSIISQREIGIDTENYKQGLRAALRESPDVIFLGEMRDLETMQIAMTAAETGQLVLSTLHTLGVGSTIDRIIDVFPVGQQQQIRVQLAMVLQGIVSQQLIPGARGMVPVFETMFMNNAIRNMIREGKMHQLESTLYSFGDDGMKTMDESILEAYKKRLITKENAKFYSIYPEIITKKIISVGIEE